MGSYPMAADLDLDGVPEILLTFFELDVGALYIFRADGTPYQSKAGSPLVKYIGMEPLSARRWLPIYWETSTRRL